MMSILETDEVDDFFDDLALEGSTTDVVYENNEVDDLMAVGNDDVPNPDLVS